ncbi:hypothetical protein [Paenibacillus prosopidis]|uniref:DUF4025 domain-containing protein n=1 Tax=Paenibacillus prosopidis TaxID=630520 RepID=A0A368W2P4_9BACL|nr:hypothetical protein [Paenibacillus prosopidis]RCW48085.1 hypothetical protein DFP97_107288 [Paenibacillus prosopidis]
MNDRELEKYVPVTSRNERYDESRIVEDGNEPIKDPDVDAIAAVKGHIERQDLEGTEFGSEEELSGDEEQCRELE